MQKQPTTKALNTKPDAIICMLDIDLIDPPPRNTRGKADKKKQKELDDSVRKDGVLQSILVRPVKQGRSTRYQIIAGARRFCSAKNARLKQIPAQIKEYNDNDALGAQLVENIQREDIHPLDEAAGLLRLKEEVGLSISECARRIGKQPGYVARQLALNNLIEEAKADFRQDLITLGHALEICRLSPEIQKEALEVCYERKMIWNQQDQTNTYVPDKEKPVRHVKYLQDWIERNVHLNLHSAPFKMDDARLREDGLTCINCPERTGHDQLLFADIKETDTCLNPLCFQKKLGKFVQLKKEELDHRNGKPSAYISSQYHGNDSGKGIIGRSDYQLLEKKADRCQYAEQAVYIDSKEIGQVRWICREKDCKDHLGRVRQYDSHSSGSTSESLPEARNSRRQELFDIRVNEVTRKRAMTEIVKTYGWPLDRADWNEIAKEFFKRIPGEHVKTILEVLGWSEKDLGLIHYNDNRLVEEIAKLDDDQLARFLRLCAFAHFGANREAQHQVSQQAVIELSKQRGVNYDLIDAQVRVERAPKKYKAVHQNYLDAISNGDFATMPVVYERPQEPEQKIETTEEGTEDTTKVKAKQQGRRNATAKAAADRKGGGRNGRS